MRGSIISVLCCLVAAEAPRGARRQLAAYNYPEVAKLTASDAAADDNFGRSVAIDGDTIVVGASGDDSRRGSVYIFRTYGQVRKLRAGDVAASGDGFGYSVAIDGDTVVVGSPNDDDDDIGWLSDVGRLSGSAYVFRTSDGGVTYGLVAKLTAADAASYDIFGISVAIKGDTIVVGAYNSGDTGAWGYDGSGAVYVFRTSDGGASYGQVAKLTAADAAAGDEFGRSVAITGDTVVIGASGDHIYDYGAASSSARPTAAPRTPRWPS
jgi:hypothetical protein